MNRILIQRNPSNRLLVDISWELDKPLSNLNKLTIDNQQFNAIEGIISFKADQLKALLAVLSKDNPPPSAFGYFLQVLQARAAGEKIALERKL